MIGVDGRQETEAMANREFPTSQSKLPPLKLSVQDSDGELREIRFGDDGTGVHYLIVDRGQADKLFAYRYSVDPDSMLRFARRVIEVLASE